MTPGLLASLLSEVEDPEPIVEDLWVYRHWVIARTRRFAIGSIIEHDRGWMDGGAELAAWRGRRATAVIREGLASGNPVVRAAAMACLNGSIRLAPSAWDGRATDPFRAAARRERTCFVGHFDEAAGWRDAGDPVTIVELDPQPGDVHWDDAGAALAAASLVFVTGFTLLNGTFEQVVARTPNARLRILMGPSVPCSARLLDHGVQVVAGSLVTDADRLLRYFQYGGTSIRKAPPGSFRRINITDGRSLADLVSG